MKTILSRLKDLITANRDPGDTLEYVRTVEVVHPDLDQTVFSIANLPKIIFTPESTSESWIGSGKKLASNQVTALLIMRYHQRETSIMGDSSRPGGQGKGIVDFVADFLSVVRGHRLSTGGSVYLDRPIDVTNVDYIAEDLGENGHFLIARIAMQCDRLFDQATLPGNI